MDEGRILEHLLYNEIRNSYENIYTEKQLIQNFGFQASSIDFLIIKNNIVICIQTKWKKSRRKENKGVHNFLDSITYLKTTDLFKNKLLHGIWASRRDPFLDNKKLMKILNVHCYSCYDSMEGLISGTKNICSNICV